MKKPIPVHPVLFAVLPILFLYSHNIRYLYLAQLAVPALIAASASVFLWLLLALLLRDRLRAASVTSLFALWFLSFGHLYSLAAGSPSANLASARSTAFVAVYSTLLLVAAGFLISQRRGVHTLTSMLNVAAVALVGLQVLQVGHYEVRRALAYRRVKQAGEISLTPSSRARLRPNIYHIILDGYARADVLRDIYHYDNSEFLRYLAVNGFQVASHGKANYIQTALSLASSLNMEYLDELAAQIGPGSNDLTPAARMIHHNRLFQFLRRRGYRIVAFSAEYDPVDIRSADLYIQGVSGLSEFDRLIMGTTPIPTILGGANPDLSELPHAQRVLYTLQHLADTTKLEPPHFVFAHIMSPHPPFTFDRNGRVVKADLGSRIGNVDAVPWPSGNLDQEYVEQVRFINRRIEAALGQIIANARWPTVIVLQSDHGSSSRTDWNSAQRTDIRERFGALIACRLPGADRPPIDDGISAVNVFRMVLNRYFDAGLPLLPNESYFSRPYRSPYQFVRVTDRVDLGARKHAARQ
jgi:hypothetical protein